MSESVHEVSDMDVSMATILKFPCFIDYGSLLQFPPQSPGFNKIVVHAAHVKIQIICGMDRFFFDYKCSTILVKLLSKFY